MGNGTCSVDGCDREVLARGWCRVHYGRWQRGRPLDDPIRLDPLERICARLVDEGDCLVWTGYCNPMGYGQIKIERRAVLVHRYVFERAVGPIPEGMHVCHHCDNPPCCNPAHLFVGTDHDNAVDKMAKGRGRGQFEPGHYPARWLKR